MGDQARPVALRVLCGLVVFLAALAVLGALLRGFRAPAGVLARTADRPTLAVTLALLVGGTACVYATPIGEVLALRSAVARVSMDTRLGGGVAIQSGSPSPFTRHRSRPSWRASCLSGSGCGVTWGRGARREGPRGGCASRS
jgi:hypothetical protein